MKTKFFILGLLSLFGIFNYANALELSCQNDTPSISSITLDAGTVINSYNGDCSLTFNNVKIGDSDRYLPLKMTNDWSTYNYENVDLPVVVSETYETDISCSCYDEESHVLTVSIGNGNSGGSGGEGGIIENGTSAFSGIIDKLGNITTEFVPYLIYIFIGILGISLAINTVKNILGYLKGESTNVIKTPYDREGMKARRRRRRRNRRFGKFLRKNYPNKKLKFGQYGYNSWRD